MSMKKHSEINWASLIEFLLQQVGKPYVFGVENDPTEYDWTKYRSWDCSEIVEVAFFKIGLEFPDGSYNQAKVVQKILNQSLLIGDLGFKWNPETEVIHHVGINIGDNRIVEAKGKAWGVVITPMNEYIASSHFAFFGRHKEILDA
jgi:cell wall-associated NlpC family hydrolase